MSNAIEETADGPAPNLWGARGGIPLEVVGIRFLGGSILTLLCACSKEPAPVAKAEPATSATVMPVPAASSVATAAEQAVPPTASASAAAGPADGGTRTATTNTMGKGAASTAAATPEPALPAAVAFHKEGSNYRIDVNPTVCESGATCEAAVRLEARSGYHINKEYPYKVKAEPNPTVTFANADGVFSRTTGDFKEDGETAGVLKVRFTPKAPGAAKIRGLYKFSVCSASDCRIDQADLAFEAPVKRGKP